MLMTSLPRAQARLAWTRAQLLSDQRQQSKLRGGQRNQDGGQDGGGLDPRPLRRRCSCGCDPIPSPTATGNSYGGREVEIAGRWSRDCGGWCHGRGRRTRRAESRTGNNDGGGGPEVEIARSRDGRAAEVELVRESRGRPSPTGNTYAGTGNTVGLRPEVEIAPHGSRDGVRRPAIEMNRQQILRVYVVGGGSDVSDHVTADGPISFALIRPNGAAMTSQYSGSPDVVKPEAEAICQRRFSQPLPVSETAQRSGITDRDKPLAGLSEPRIMSPLHQPYQVCTASVDRKRVEKSTWDAKPRKTASLDRRGNDGNFHESFMKHRTTREQRQRYQVRYYS